MTDYPIDGIVVIKVLKFLQLKINRSEKSIK